MHKARAFFFVCAGIFLLALSQAHALDVRYDANTLPIADPVAPWQLSGPGLTSTYVSDGILCLSNASSSWGLFVRDEPSGGDEPVFNVEVMVRVPSNNAMSASPTLALCDYDPTRPIGDIAHLWYGLDFYPTRIDLSKADRDLNNGVVPLGTVPIPDLGTVFHKVRLTRYEGADRRFELWLDDALVLEADGEPADKPLNAVVFGYGSSVGAGNSEWDYVRYWSEAPVPAMSTSWGRIKALYR
jgi:hypothetical protein